MKKRLYNILKGKFLINDDAIKNWQFILFCALLAMIMIACSHSAERKVHQIAKLTTVTQELRSRFVDQRQELMQMKMESSIGSRLEEEGIKALSTPPRKIIVEQ